MNEDQARTLREQTLEGRHFDKLWLVTPDCEVRPVECSYEGIRAALDDSAFDAARSNDVTFFVKDMGMYEAERLNFPASILCGQALYGPAVMAAARPDDEGDSVPPPVRVAMALQATAHLWGEVRAHAELYGQSLDLRANPDTIPPPRVIGMSHEQMNQFLATGELPEEIR